MRKALVVGVNHYDHIGPLHGCVKDAYGVESMLKRDSDGSVNFSVKLMTSTAPGDDVPRDELIPSCTDQHSCAHLRIPMDLMRAGWPISLFQASQQ
jgi:hypothetical protein